MSDATPQMLGWYRVLPDGRYVPTEDAAMRGVRPTPPHTTAEPQPEFTIPEGWRRLQVGEILQPGDQIVQIDDGRRYPTHRVGDAVGEKQQYIRRIELDADMTEELHRILQRCEANETTFDNQDMSVVLQEVYRLRRIIISQFE